MIVTQPVVGKAGGRTLIVVPTFMPDSTHRAGVFALALDTASGQPKLETAWTFPDPSCPEATQRYRYHPSRAALATLEGSAEPIVLLVEPGTVTGKRGVLTALRLADGQLLGETFMAGHGIRYIEPLVVGDVVYTPSCATDFGPSALEAHRISVER
jgi:hypothetical protein